MRILISNDDGYRAPGIQELAKVLAEIADVVVIAPERNRSGASNSLTLDNPLRVREVEKNVYFVNGTPTDCVHLAVIGLLDQMPDMAISGINHGANLGDDVLYSGTVAAAIEGRFLGLPSIAISLSGDAQHLETAAFVAKDLIQQMATNPLPASTILNVNVPDLPLEELGEYEVTRLGSRHRAQPFIKQSDPRGEDVYWIGLPGPEGDGGSGTDFHAVRSGNVSITPLQIDWTNFKAFEGVSSWVTSLNQSLKTKSL